jgi:hypothetical protein
LCRRRQFTQLHHENNIAAEIDPSRISHTFRQ